MLAFQKGQMSQVKMSTTALMSNIHKSEDDALCTTLLKRSSKTFFLQFIKDASSKFRIEIKKN